MITVVPGVRPITTPVVLPTVPTAIDPLVHVPPGEVLVSPMVEPGHTAPGPVTGAGSGLMIIVTLPVIERVQPAADVANTV